MSANFDDTIYALSTAVGRAGIAVVRVSGASAKTALDMICGAIPERRTAVVRDLRSPADGSIIDRAIVLWLPGPRSFTGEDVAEFHVHGGQAVVAAVLNALVQVDGCRPASAGEFTRRAFFNGKMDLVAVEGLADLIAADTEAQRRQALFHQHGGASAQYSDMRDRLVRALAHIEAAIDFADEDGVEETAVAQSAAELADLRVMVQAYLNDDNRGERLRDGIRIVIAGPPNAGKSSLLNALARRDAAIVSAIEGTTRDSIEVSIDLAGVPVIFVDTAGLRERAGDEIESLGMERTRRQIGAADLTLWLDAPDIETTGPAGFDSDVLRVLNKVDLLETRAGLDHYDMVTSALSETGVEALVSRLGEIAAAQFMAHKPALITRHRHRVALQNCLDHINQALASTEKPPELVAESVRLAARELAKLVGQVDVEDLLDVIFRDFCIGK